MRPSSLLLQIKHNLYLINRGVSKIKIFNNNNLINKSSIEKEFLFFIVGYSLFCFAQSIIDSTINNFLNETFKLTNIQRSLLELPRELPGFLVICISAILFFLCSRRLAALANLICAIGRLLIGFFSLNLSMMIMWLFVLSVGQHLFLPLNQSLGMEFARDGKTGKRLGQQTGVGNIFAILGSLVIFIGFKFFNFNFKISYSLAAICFLLAALFIFLMKPTTTISVREKFMVKKDYGLYYWLCILFGTRKQIFLTFAPWVLVTVFNQKTQMIATLLTIGGVIGIFFKPLVGRAIDKFGEKIILASEAFILIFVCVMYGFSKKLFSQNVALFVTMVCYLIDLLLMSVSMARATYLKKIAINEKDVSQTLSMGVSIDHIFSIVVALISGVIWFKFGYQYVFLLGGVIAFINLISTLQIKVPNPKKC